MKNHRRRLGGRDFLVKMGVVHIGENVYRRGCKQCFSLIIYGFCGSNALYSASLSFRMVISDVAYKGVAYKKHVALFFSLLKMRQ